MNGLKEEYSRRHSQFLVPIAKALETHLRDICSSCSRIDRISSRAKSADRFVKKAEKIESGRQKYSNPLTQIQDQIGARIVTFYSSDVQIVAEVVKQHLRPIESKAIIPDGDNEFGYEGRHFIMILPSDVTAEFGESDDIPSFFELQIKTLFQHAWSEAEHDVGYKPSSPLTHLQKRKIAFTAAQAWGADRIFDELFQELNPTEKPSRSD